MRSTYSPDVQITCNAGYYVDIDFAEYHILVLLGEIYNLRCDLFVRATPGGEAIDYHGGVIVNLQRIAARLVRILNISRESD